MITNVGETYHLLEMRTEDRVVDLNRLGGGDVGHGDCLEAVGGRSGMM